MALATLSIDLVAGLAKLQEGLDKAGRLSEKQANEMDRRLSAVKGGAVALGAALGAAFSVAAVKQWAGATIDGLDALNDLKDATGASIENLSALEDVGARTGTAFESVGAILIKFNKVLSDSKPGAQAEQILKNLGLSAEELKKIDPAEALRQTAVALSTYTDEGNKARYVQALFGKSVAEAAPFLKALSEQGRLNATVTTEQAQAAEDFNKALFNLQKNATDASRTLLSDLVPAMASVLKTFNDQGLRAAVDDFGERIFGWTSNQQRKEIGRVQSEIEDLRHEFDLWDGVPVQQQRVAAAIDASAKKLADLNRAYLKLNDGSAGGGRGAVNPDVVRPTLGDLPEDNKAAKVSEFEKYLDQLEKATLATLDLTEVEKVEYAIATGALGKLNEQQKEHALQLAEGLDLLKQTEKQYSESTELDRRYELQKQMNELLEGAPTAQLEKQRKLQLAIAEAYEKGIFGAVGNAEAVAKYTEAVKAALPELEKLQDESTEFSKQAAANIQNAFGQTIKSSLKGDFDDILDLWGNLLFDMASQAAAAKLNQALFGSEFSSSGNIGGLIGQLFSSFSGGTTYGGTGTTDANLIGDYAMPSTGPSSAGRASRMSATSVNNYNYTYNVAAGVQRGELLTALQMSERQNEARTTSRLRALGVA